MPLVPELHGDAVALEGEQLLAQPVAALALPLARQERRDLGPPPQERVPVPPDRVLRVRQLDVVGVPNKLKGLVISQLVSGFFFWGGRRARPFSVPWWMRGGDNDDDDADDDNAWDGRDLGLTSCSTRPAPP